MDCVARREEFPALAKLFVDSFGGTEQFAMSVLENFAGEGNVFAARQDGACTALLCAVPVTLCGRKGAYYYGLTTRPDQRGTGVMTALMDAAGQEQTAHLELFTVRIQSNDAVIDFLNEYGVEGVDKEYQAPVNPVLAMLVSYVLPFVLIFLMFSLVMRWMAKKGGMGGMGGIGGKMTPSAVIVIQDGKTRLVNIKNQDTVTKLLDLVPDVVDRFTAKKEDRMTEDDVMDILDSDEE